MTERGDITKACGCSLGRACEHYGPSTVYRATTFVDASQHVRRLRAALLRYGRHLDGCGASSLGQSACTCGFEAACR